MGTSFSEMSTVNKSLIIIGIIVGLVLLQMVISWVLFFVVTQVT